MRPFRSETPSSFASNFFACSLCTWPSAIERTIKVMVWLPEFPPIPATIGISAASATSFSIECSKAPITREAKIAVTRLIASHDQRFFTLAQTDENTSSSSRSPA